MSNQLSLFFEKDEFLDNLDRRIEIGNKILPKQKELELLIEEICELNAYYGCRPFDLKPEYDRKKAVVMSKLIPLEKEIKELTTQFMEVWNELSRPKKRANK